MIGMQLIFVTIAVETCVIETAQAVDQFLHLVSLQVLAVSVECLHLLISLLACIGQKAQQLALSCRQVLVWLV